MPFKKIYERQEDGTLILISSEEYSEPTIQEIIADKEAKLLEMYEEIQLLKNPQ